MGLPPPNCLTQNQDWGRARCRLCDSGGWGQKASHMHPWPLTPRASLTHSLQAHENVQLDLLKKGLIGTGSEYKHACTGSTWCKESKWARLLRGQSIHMRKWRAHGARLALAAKLLNRCEQQYPLPPHPSGKFQFPVGRVHDTLL